MSTTAACEQTCRVLLVTSAKGGVGKTTVSAVLAALLAKAGYRTLAIDLDLSNRCLDLMCGVQDLALYNVRDAALGVPLARAVVPDPRLAALSYLSAPLGGYLERPDKASLRTLLQKAAESGCYDRIVIDTPGAFDEILLSAADVATEAIVLSTAQEIALRSAAVTAAELERLGVAKRSLIVNCFEGRRLGTAQTAQLIRYIDETALQLLGIIPFDKKLWRLQNRGLLITDPAYRKTRFSRAMEEIVRRAEGEAVPLGIGHRY